MLVVCRITRFVRIILTFLVQTYFCSVFRCFTGFSLDRLINELPLVRDLSPKAVVIDIGTNDLSNVGVDPVILARRGIDFAKLFVAVNSVSEVLVCQVLPRVLVRATGISDACPFQRRSFYGKPYAGCLDHRPAPYSLLAAPRHARQLAAIFFIGLGCILMLLVCASMCAVFVE